MSKLHRARKLYKVKSCKFVLIFYMYVGFTLQQIYVANCSLDSKKMWLIQIVQYYLQSLDSIHNQCILQSQLFEYDILFN